MTAKALFPLELHGECLSHLASDRAALNTASLVCKHWLNHTRPYILDNKSITLGDTYPPAGIRLLGLLSSPYSTLQTYLQRAYLLGFEYGAFDPKTKSNDFTYNNLNSIIIQNLSQLRRLKSLTLMRFTWQRLSDEARSCLVSSFPDLEFICFDQVAFSTPLDLVKVASSFQNTIGLRLLQPIFDDSAVFDNSDNVNAALDKLLVPRLTFLDISFNAASWSITSSLFSGIKTPSIKTLCISWFDENCEVIKLALRNLGPSLEHLALQSELDDLPFDLSGLKTLKTLEIVDDIASTAIAHLLQSIQSPTFRELHLRCWTKEERSAVEQLWATNSFPKSTRRLYIKYRFTDEPGVGLTIPENMKKDIEVVELYQNTSAASVFQGWYPYDL